MKPQPTSSEKVGSEKPWSPHRRSSQGADLVSGPAVLHAPSGGLWRVGRGPDPLTVRPVEGTRPRLSSGGNRFDPQSDYAVLYFGTTLQACFAETLARFRPNIKLLALVGRVEASWFFCGWRRPGRLAPKEDGRPGPVAKGRRVRRR